MFLHDDDYSLVSMKLYRMYTYIGATSSVLPLPPMPPSICNTYNSNVFNSTFLPSVSRWGVRTSCPIHSPFRGRIPNGSICSGHQVKHFVEIKRFSHYISFRSEKQKITNLS